MADVVLVNCPMAITYRGGPPPAGGGDELSHTPLGLLYLASSLEKAGLGVVILDPTPQDLRIEDIIERIRAERPLLVGFSAMTSGLRAAVRIASQIKKDCKDSPLLCIGGAHINSDPEFVSRFPIFDFAVIGEAELTLIDLTRQIKGGARPKGIIQARPIDDLDSLPPPARHLIDEKRYYREEARRDVLPAATMIASRGCPFDCVFCSMPVFRKGFRVRSPGNIVDEMEAIAAAHGNRFNFVDDTLTLNRVAILGICDEIIKRGSRFRWWGMTRATSLDDEMAARMRQAGCTDIFIGVEAGNERIRNEVVKKNVSDEAICNAVRICRRHGIQTKISLIIGFPTETKREINDTVAFGRRCKADLMGVRILVPFPGAALFDHAVKNNIVPADLADRYARGELGEGFIGTWPLFVPEGLTLKDLRAAIKRAYINFYLNPRWIIRRIADYAAFPERFKDDMRLLGEWYYVLLFGKTSRSMS